LGVSAAVRLLRADQVDCLETLSVKSRVRQLREQFGWSQAELAERLDVSRQTVNAIETEKYDPSIKLAFKISRLFELPIEAIFTED
jgi:putative transcriptional regulator